MEARPEDMPEVFVAYREGLYQQQQELAALIAAAEGVDPEKLTSTKQLISVMEGATQRLPLPAMDIRPRFRYLDDQEKIGAPKKKALLHEKRQEERLRIGVHTAINAEAMYKKGNARSLDLGNEQKLAVLQMLRED